ncbi:MAG: ferritin family protein [Candidatus Eisenbacteria bacterium]
MDTFKASEVLRVAMKIEENGERLYRHATTLAGDTETKDFFGFLADEETKHKKTFEAMLSKAEHYQPSETYPGEHLVYLRAYADNIIFSPDKVEKEIAGLTDVDSVLEFGIQREIESILYYLETRNLVPDSQREQIDKIIDEERRHYLRLVDVRKNLS